MTSPNISFTNTSKQEFRRNDEGEQYIKQYGERWLVRIQGANQGEKVVLRGTPPFPLVPLDRIASDGESEYWKVPKNLTFDEKKNLVGAGYIIAELLDDANRSICEATLLVIPSNVTEKELDQMIKEIGQLALSTASYLHKRFEGGQGEGDGIGGVGLQWHPSIGLSATATSLLELAEVVKNNWDTLKKRPLKSFITQIEPVSINKLKTSPQALIKAKVNPAKQQILGFTRTESTQCSENEFICYVLDVYLRDLANSIADSIELLKIETIDYSLIDNSSPKTRMDLEFIKFKQQSKNKVQDINREVEEFKKGVKLKVSQLRDCANWATKARASAFLKTVNTPIKAPVPSLRLIGSPTYGSIYKMFSNCKGGTLQPIQKVLYLIKCIYEGQIRTTWEIYEIWCFVRLYSAFILYGNMEPTKNESLFDLLIDTSEGLKLPINEKYQLQTRIDNGDLIKVNFWYDTEIYYTQSKKKRPDIRMEITINDESPKQYCFDAKYRNYQKQDPEKLKEDVIDVARDKYLNLLKSSASFILHTDESVDYWGEVPFEQLIDNTKIPDCNTEYVGHKYGAIRLRPQNNTEKELKKIIRLLLQYHASPYMRTVCIACGHQLEYETEVRTSWLADYYSETQLIEYSYSIQPKLTTALYCSCKLCSDFWVVSHCLGNHHLLLKFQDSFHKQSDPDSSKWLYDCPECGSELLPYL